MLAAGPHTRNGRARCLLAQFAASSVPDAEVPDTDDVVRTGGGLVVPRVPAYQSVDGPAVTLPPRSAVQDSVIERAREVIAARRRESTHAR